MPSQHVYFTRSILEPLIALKSVRSTQVILNMHMEKPCNTKRKSHFKLIVKTIKKFKKINTRLCLDVLCLLQLYHGVNRRVLCTIRLYWNAQLNLKVKLAKNVEKHILDLFISFYFYNLFVLFLYFFIMLSSPHPYYDLTYYYTFLSLSLNFIFCTRCPVSNSLASCGQYFYNIKCLLIKFVVVVVWLKPSLGLFPQLNNQMDVVEGIMTRSKKRKSFLSPCHSLLDSANLSVNCFSSYFVIFVHAD